MSGISQRMMRVNEALREVISAALAREVKDPRIGFVTVTGVHATTDLRQAKVYVSVLGTQKEKDATLEGLRSATSVLQKIINAETHFRRTPELEFVYDNTIDTGMRIQVILRDQTEGLTAEDNDGDEGEDALEEADDSES